jgi:hypothetical protein
MRSAARRVLTTVFFSGDSFGPRALTAIQYISIVDLSSIEFKELVADPIAGR